MATKMVVDTLLTSAGSHLTIDADAASDGTVDIVFAEGRPAAHANIYTDAGNGDGVIGRHQWDPEQLSLGLVATGKVVVHGHEVESGLQLAEGPAAGATQIVFDALPGDTGWAIGQQIVVGGTSFLGDDADGKLITQDEVRIITDVQVVDGQMVVTLDSALEHDHIGATNPQTGLELPGFVGNLSRNVTFSSDVADQNGDGMADRGVSLDEPLGANEHYVTERGHVMFMHNDDVSVQNSAFFGLGRTDKSTPIDDYETGGLHNNRLHNDTGARGSYDPETEAPIETAANELMNQRGRYAIHLHEADGHDHGDDHAGGHGVIGPCPETGGSICHCGDQDGDGLSDCEDEDYFDGAYLQGNVVWGTPGWGIVQHSSAAVLEDNVVYDAAGSAFVTELGNETGRWTDNLAIGTYGVRERQPNEDADDFNEDDGAEGVGFYTKSRAIEFEDNAAVSSGRAGFFFHTNGADVRPVKVPETGPLATLAQGRDYIPAEDVPILVFTGNQVIAAREGIRITTDPLDAVRKFNDAWSVFNDFIAQEVDESGVSATYSSKYVFQNFLILGTANKVSDIAQETNSGFFFRVSTADVTVVDSHVASFDHAVTNWSQVGDRQEYRRGYWDPKDPAGNPWVDAYEGLGAVEGIENPVWNLWNTNIVNVTYEDLEHGWLRASNINVDMGDGTEGRMRGTLLLDSAEDAPGTPGVEIELLGDSRDGGLVALWREEIANNPDQAAMLQQHIPLAYQESVFLSQIWYQDGSEVKRRTFDDYEENINADYWSGTVLEFAKEDSLGRQVFLYGDFAPLDPGSIERTVTTNERLVLTKEMIDGTLVKDGYYSVNGIEDVKFVVVDMLFSDRLNGDLVTHSFLVALDLAWELPDGAQDAGLLLITADLIVAPQYRVFENGVLVEGRDPIVLGDAPTGIISFQSGSFTTDAGEELSLGAGEDRIHAGGGDDVVRGFASADYIDGGAGDDALFGGQGWDRLTGGTGRDHLDGGDHSDALTAGNGNDEAWGGAGNDTIDGGNHKDSLWGGDGDDRIIAGQGFDTAWGGAGDDVITGNAGKDVLYGGDGADAINGGALADKLFGGAGNDLLHGAAGMDAIYGGAGDDLLEGQMGSDALHGGLGEDALSGGAGIDRLFGGDGADQLTGGQGNDRLTGGEGADRFVFDDTSENDVITDFEDGVDAIEFMIQAFGFEDLDIVQDGTDAVVHHLGAELRLIKTDATTLDESDFAFSDPAA